MTTHILPRRRVLPWTKAKPQTVSRKHHVVCEDTRPFIDRFLSAALEGFHNKPIPARKHFDGCSGSTSRHPTYDEMTEAEHDAAAAFWCGW